MKFLNQPALSLLHLAMGFAIFLVANSCEAQELRRFEYSHPAMGVVFDFVVYAENQTVVNEALRQASQRIDELNLVFSDYLSNSETSRLSENSPHENWVVVSPEFFDLTRRTIGWSRQTNGAFDITAGAATKLWRNSIRQRELPTPAEIDRARETIGWQQIQMGEPHQIRLHRSGVRLDFGGIAKGFASDEALRVLAAHQIKIGLVNASGDISVQGLPPGREYWVCELPQHDAMPRIELRLTEQSVATSGSRMQSWVVDGQRYSHIIDPRTATTVSHVVRATVIASNGTDADALATACSVLPPSESLELAESLPGVELMLLWDRDAGTSFPIPTTACANHLLSDSNSNLQVLVSSGFMKLVVQD